MKTCTLFGDDDFDKSLHTQIRHTMIDLIENYNVDLFYIGETGMFNLTVAETLEELSGIYSHIYYEIAVCNIPYRKYNILEIFFENLMLFGSEEGKTKEQVFKEMNEWMVSVSDYIVTYVRDYNGEASRLKSFAEKNEKTVIVL